MPRKAYMAFAADTPMVGLDPHPAYAPQDVISKFDADGYFEALGAYDQRDEIVKECQADHEARLEAVENGDLEDADEPDEVFEVAIHDCGRVQVFHSEPRYVIATYEMNEIYDAFGMEMPTKP